MNTIVIIILIILLCCCCSAGGYAYNKYYIQPRKSAEPIPFIAKKSSYTFDPNATEYSKDNAGFLCDVSNQAYYPEEDCREWAQLNGFKEKFLFFDTHDLDPSSHTQGFVAQNPDTILIAFRGTEASQLSDLLADLQAALKVQWETLGMVHPGFLTAFKAVQDKTFGDTVVFPDLIKDAVKSGKRKIWITGHSLGGALAVLCAAQLSILGKIPIHAVYTYGQPRVGDEQFAENMNDNLGDQIFRVVNNRDIIPRLAMYTLGYRQFGQEVFFDKSRRREMNKPKVENMEGALVGVRKTENIQELVYGGFAQGLGFLKQLESTTNVKNIMNNVTDQIKNHLLTSYLFLLENEKDNEDNEESV
jgi:triacylglycerol lipase